MSKKEKQHCLYSIWKSEKGYENFVYDGILNYSIWENYSPKVLFLLKESTNDFKNIAEQKIDIRQGSGKHFWWNICYWKYLIEQLYKNQNPEFINKDKLPEVKYNNHILDSIAYVNIKKKCENNNSSKDKDILQYAINDRRLLVEQINLINPNVIFCSDITFKSYKHLYPDNLKKINTTCYNHNNRLIIKFRHPGFFQIKGGRERNFYDLKKQLTESNIFKNFRWENCG